MSPKIHLYDRMIYWPATMMPVSASAGPQTNRIPYPYIVEKAVQMRTNDLVIEEMEAAAGFEIYQERCKVHREDAVQRRKNDFMISTKYKKAEAGGE